MSLRGDVLAALAADPSIDAEVLAERMALPLESVAASLRSLRFWTPEKRAMARAKSKSRAIPLSELKADSATYRAIKEGILVRPSTCSACGVASDRIDGHHHDYSQPLVVIWLCRKCHSAANAMRHAGEPYNAEVVRILAKIRANPGWKAREL